MITYPLKMGYLRKQYKSWKKGSKQTLLLLSICKMRVKDYFTV
jgi:hypothetical protein